MRGRLQLHNLLFIIFALIAAVPIVVLDLWEASATYYSSEVASVRLGIGVLTTD